MGDLVAPHGGTLLPLMIAEGAAREYALTEARRMRKVGLSSQALSDVVMFGMGAFSPLTGFLKQEDYLNVLNESHLANGTLWPIPITLPVSNETAASIAINEQVALFNPDASEIVGTMVVEETYTYDKKLEARQVFRTEDERHPAVANLCRQGEAYLAGAVQVFSEAGYRDRFPEFATPKETRRIFSGRGWKTVAAFQTRNPMHRSHEYLTKLAMEICDGILIHPLVGRLKTGDVPAEVRMETYRALLDNYYPKNRVALKVYPLEMRYGGPKEAILHAIIRQNFGCSHLIVGRDHAGVGNYYGAFDAQLIFDELEPGDLHIRPLKLDTAFWCRRCGAVASQRTCPHGEEDHLTVSGTELRRLLRVGEHPPEELMRPEVADILATYYQGQNAE